MGARGTCRCFGYGSGGDFAFSIGLLVLFIRRRNSAIGKLHGVTAGRQCGGDECNFWTMVPKPWRPEANNTASSGVTTHYLTQ